MTPERQRDLDSQLRPEAWLALFGSVLVMISLAGYLYGIKPALAELHELASDELEIDLDAIRAELESNDDTIAILEAQTAQLHETLYGASAHLASQQMEAWIIGSLDRISRRHGVQLLRVEPGKGDQVMMFDELPYEVEVVGGYFALYEWLDVVESELRPMVVKQFEMGSSGADARVRMRLRLVAYRPSEEAI